MAAFGSWPTWYKVSPDYAYHFIVDVVRRSSVEMRRYVQVLADRILTGKVFVDQLTAHNHFVRPGAAFIAGKESPVHKRDSEGAEIAWIGPAH